MLVTPYDRRLPFIRVRTRVADRLLGQRFVVRVDSWERTSRYACVWGDCMRYTRYTPNAVLCGARGRLGTDIQVCLCIVWGDCMKYTHPTQRFVVRVDGWERTSRYACVWGDCMKYTHPTQRFVVRVDSWERTSRYACVWVTARHGISPDIQVPVNMAIYG